MSQLDTASGAHSMRRLIYGAAACLTLAACADSTTDPTAGISLAKVPTTTPSACPPARPAPKARCRSRRARRGGVRAVREPGGGHVGGRSV